ncbi:PAS domain-containing hybrid sensor histidine kinase/response regulator, partial [Desulfogranum marinum]|uniref:PAS domain-containing hybrid sensor histidine kinase/response regulator n=1 Tax=Desulfogranum marinum TaxID=453220 RepID=UPI0019646F38
HRKQLIETGEPQECDLRLVKPDGALLWAQLTVNAAQAEDGPPPVCYLVLSDITDRKKAEVALTRTTNELNDGNNNLKAILSAVLSGILVFNQNARIISDNPSARAMFGIEENKPGSLRYGDYIGCCHRHNHPDGCGSTADCPDCEINTAIAQVLAGAIDGTENREMEILRDKEKGKSLWVQFSVSLVVVQGQRCAILVTNDITRQKQATEELEKAEKLLRKSQRMGKIGGWEWDMERQSMVWTDETYRIHGFTPDEYELGSPEHIARSLACYHPEAREDVLKAFERCVSTGEPYDFEVPFTNTAGQPMWIHTTGQAAWKGDRIAKVSGILMDITDRKRAEKELQQSEEFWRITLSSISDTVIMTDEQGFITFVCPNVSFLFGLAENEMLAKSRIENVTGPLIEVMELLECSGSVQNIQREIIDQYGKKHHVLIDVKKVSIQEHRYLYVLHEATELIESRKELILAKKRAEASTKAKSQFLSNMSHELRTPLNAVIGFSQLLARDSILTERQRSEVEVVLRSGQSLLDIINDILEISRIEAGHLEIRPVNFSMHQLLLDLEEMFRSRCEAKGLHLVVEQDDAVPEFLYGDRTKLQQIFLNLLSNAFKFTEKGGISVRVRGDVCQRDDVVQKETLRLNIEVKDSGIGISAENLESIFRPFDQVEFPMNIGGTGLGLSICREYAVLLGGDIRVVSEPGRGSCFIFTVDMAQGKAISGTGAPAYREAIGLEADTGPVRILVVDDNSDDRVLVKALLAPIGFEVSQAVNGIEALALTKKIKPDAVLMDMRMPDMDGYEATRRIKATAAGLDTSVIALTASAFTEGQQKTLDAGVDGYLRKPFQPWELLEILGRCLGLRYVHREDNDQKLPAPTIEAVSELSEALRKKLMQAVEEGDMGLFEELLEQAVESHPELVRKLGKLADVFDYPRLNALLAGKGGGLDEE